MTLAEAVVHVNDTNFIEQVLKLYTTEHPTGAQHSPESTKKGDIKGIQAVTQSQAWRPVQ